MMRWFIKEFLPFALLGVVVGSVGVVGLLLFYRLLDRLGF